MTNYQPNQSKYELNSMQRLQLDQSTFDCIVIGAGVAGSYAAIRFAQHGYRTLIVDAKEFPREKVCGCCLNQRGVGVLERAGLKENLHQLGGAIIDQWHLSLMGKSFHWSIPTIVSTPRSSLDTMLVDEAVAAGAVFLHRSKATVLPTDDEVPSVRAIELRYQGEEPRKVNAKLVLVADGLTQSSLSRLPEFGSTVEKSARIGIQAMLPRDAIPSHLQHQLIMLVSQYGYVGIAPVSNSVTDLAAAIDPTQLNSQTRPYDVVFKILRNNNIQLPYELLSQLNWLATPPLTRRSTRCGEDRILLIGDSLGYVEPFTGEGMSWALRSAELVQELACNAIEQWDGSMVSQWQKLINTRLLQQQWMCSALTKLLRYPQPARFLATSIDYLPQVRKWAMQKVSAQ